MHLCCLTRAIRFGLRRSVVRGWTTVRVLLGRGEPVRAVVPSLFFCSMVLAQPRSATASGSPSLHVKEPVDQGGCIARCLPESAQPARSDACHLLRIQRGPHNAAPIEAFLEVGPDGVPGAVNVTNVDDLSNGDLAACLLKCTDKVRFPASEGPVEVKAVLGPAPAEDDDESKRWEAARACEGLQNPTGCPWQGGEGGGREPASGGVHGAPWAPVYRTVWVRLLTVPSRWGFAWWNISFR